MEPHQQKGERPPIRVDSIGIDETDVEACMNINQLLQWRLAVDGEIQRIKARITNLSVPKHMRTAEMELAFKKADKFRALMSIFLQRINLRINYLKRELKQSKAEGQTQAEKTIDRYFRETAKDYLTGQQYKEIIIEAKRRMQEDSQ